MPRFGGAGAVLAVLVLAGLAFVPALGIGLEWTDLGQLVYPGWRLAHGELPYRDVPHFYWPSLFVVEAAVFRVLGEDLWSIRVLLLVVKAVNAALVFALATRVARPAFAWGVTAVFVAFAAAPTLWIFQAPYGVHFTLLVQLAALLVLARAPRLRPSTLLVAGLLLGFGATFKQTTGVFGVVAVACWLADAPAGGGARLGRLWHAAVLAAAALFAVGYVAKGTLDPSAVLLVTPLLVGIALGLRRRAAAPAAGEPGALSALFVLAAGTVAAPAAWLAFYAVQGALPALLFSTVTGLPQRVAWYVPLPAPDRTAVGIGLALLAGTVAAVAHGPLRLAGRVTVLACALVAAVAAAMAVARGVWFPDWALVLWWIPYLPLACVAIGLPFACATRDRARTPELLWWYGAAQLLSLHPAADLPHAVLVLPAVLPIAAHACDRLWTLGAQTRQRVLVAAVLGAALGLPFAIATVETIQSVRALKPGDAAIPRASGIDRGVPRAGAAAALLADLQQRVPAGAPLVALPSSPLVYFLADRASLFGRDEIVLYFATVGAMRVEEARGLLDDAAMASRLDAARPVIVRDGRWDGAIVAAIAPTLAQRIADGWRVAARYGQWEVLEPTSPAAR